MATEDCVIIFPNITYAMKFERKIKETNISVKMIPVPRSISSSCGVCGKFDCANETEIEKLCQEADVRHDGIYRVYKEK
ncbi:MAG: hypothetical protein XD91_1507 [Clostridiales bacterium 38_11]|nr:MAG: hypothetical protein XD91_1507 [Clostridiales bacterium 38_11]